MARANREKLLTIYYPEKQRNKVVDWAKSERLQHLQLPWPSNREIQAIVLNYRKNKISPFFCSDHRIFYKIRSFHIKHSILLPINIHSVTTNKNFHDRLYRIYMQKKGAV